MRSSVQKTPAAVMGRSVLLPLLVCIVTVCSVQGQVYNGTDCPHTCVCEHLKKLPISNMRPRSVRNGVYVHHCSDDPVAGLVTIFQSFPSIDGIKISHSLTHTSEGNMSRLFTEMGKLKVLHTLVLSHNNLTELPDAIGNLPSSLQDLDVSHNKLSSLPDALEHLSSLQGLFISSNNLGALPNAVRQLFSLQRLDVSSNHLTMLPDAIWYKRSLTSMNIANNQLTEVDMSKMLSVPNRVVNLSHNRIGSLVNIPTAEPNFQSLVVSHNTLSELDSWFFRLAATGGATRFGHAYKERSLDVSFNLISRITNDRGYTAAPLSNGNLKGFVDLSNNSIQHLHNVQEALNITQQDLVHLLFSQALKLANNLLSCDCIDYKIYKELKLDPPPLLCGTPADVRGRLIKFVNLDRFVCNVTDNCPSGCYCIDIPHNKSLNIICGEYYEEHLPLQVPKGRSEGYEYLINNDWGKLTNLSYRSYIADAFNASFRHNAIEYISRDFFNGTKWKFVDLRNNNLSVVDAWASRLIFHQHEAWIYLDHNSISTFTNDIKYDPEVDYLTFHHKNILNIRLSLNNNSITHFSHISIPWKVSIEDFEDLVEEDVLQMAHNPLICDCQDFEYYKIIHHKHNLTCAEPPRLVGQLISNISIDEFTCSLTENCPDGCECIDRPNHNLMSINCTNYANTTLPKKLPVPNREIDYKYRYILNFDYGSLTTLDGYEYLRRVTNASFSYNQINDVKRSFFQIFKTYKELRLDNNYIGTLPAYKVNRPIDKIYLGHNTWNCSCDNQFTLEWVFYNKKEVGDYENISCGWPDDLMNRTFDYVTELCFGQNTTVKITYIPVYTYRHNPAAVGIAVILALIILVGAVAYVMRAWIYRTFILEPAFVADNDEPEFDIFISYAEGDEKYVLNDLVPKLKKEGFQLIHFHDNFVSGRTRMWNKRRAMKKSKMTLSVYTQAYLKYGVGQHEFYSALGLQFKQTGTHLVAIKDPAIDVSTLDRDTQSYFMLDLHVDKESPNFWEELLELLPTERINDPVEVAHVATENGNLDNIEMVSVTENEDENYLLSDMKDMDMMAILDQKDK